MSTRKVGAPDLLATACENLQPRIVFLATALLIYWLGSSTAKATEVESDSKAAFHEALVQAESEREVVAAEVAKILREKSRQEPDHSWYRGVESLRAPAEALQTKLDENEN